MAEGHLEQGNGLGMRPELPLELLVTVDEEGDARAYRWQEDDEFPFGRIFLAAYTQEEEGGDLTYYAETVVSDPSIDGDTWYITTAAEVEGLRVRRLRHEELDAHAYDGILSRALSAPEAMLDVGRRLLKPGGTLVLFLQDTHPVPDTSDYAVFHVEPYAVEGKQRKAAYLRLAE